jgi:cyclopropane fatty-acyl-phospholipid synthase-like methyltransferase
MRLRNLSSAALLVAIGLLASPIAAQQATAPPLRKPDIFFVETPPEVVTAMLKLAGVTAKDVVYDLGCGAGAIVTAAARDFGASSVGIDIDPQRVKEATDRAQAAKVGDKVKIVLGDLFEADISQATVVTLYLLSTLNEKLIPKLNKDLKPGTRVVSQSFGMGEHNPPLKSTVVNGTNVYLWTTPLKPSAQK